MMKVFTITSILVCLMILSLNYLDNVKNSYIYPLIIWIFLQHLLSLLYYNDNHLLIKSDKDLKKKNKEEAEENYQLFFKSFLKRKQQKNVLDSFEDTEENKTKIDLNKKLLEEINEKINLISKNLIHQYQIDCDLTKSIKKNKQIVKYAWYICMVETLIISFSLFIEIYKYNPLRLNLNQLDSFLIKIFMMISIFMFFIFQTLDDKKFFNKESENNTVNEEKNIFNEIKLLLDEKEKEYLMENKNNKKQDKINLLSDRLI